MRRFSQRCWFFFYREFVWLRLIFSLFRCSSLSEIVWFHSIECAASAFLNFLFFDFSNAAIQRSDDVFLFICRTLYERVHVCILTFLCDVWFDATITLRALFAKFIDMIIFLTIKALRHTIVSSLSFTITKRVVNKHVFINEFICHFDRFDFHAQRWKRFIFLMILYDQNIFFIFKFSCKTALTFCKLLIAFSWLIILIILTRTSYISIAPGELALSIGL